MESAVLHIIFEKLNLVEVKPPDTLAELVERRFKKVMRREPKRQYSRAELIAETEKMVGEVGKRSLAKAFVLLGRDADVRVALGEQNRKLYGLAMPVKAFCDSILEEEGQLAAVSVLGKSIVAEAAILRLEEELKRRQESQKGNDLLGEIMRKVAEGDS